MLRDVTAFRRRFMLGCPLEPQLLLPEALQLRKKLLQEELQEFDDACAADDLPEAADALIDLVYIALGTAIEMGLPWDALWADVHRANMDKVRCKTVGESKRGSTYDLRKPDGWRPPNSANIVERAVQRAQAYQLYLAEHIDSKQQPLPGFQEAAHVTETARRLLHT